VCVGGDARRVVVCRDSACTVRDVRWWLMLRSWMSRDNACIVRCARCASDDFTRRVILGCNPVSERRTDERSE
jgi:hypothetical protein